MEKINWNKVNEAYYNECVDQHIDIICKTPVDLFDWFKNEINEYLI